MSSAPQDTPGQTFYTDLRLIREKKRLSGQDVFRATMLPLEIVSLFENTGLLSHPSYNRVYLRSFVKEYARVVGVSQEDALEALEASLAGKYNGNLAVKYLGVPESSLFRISEHPDPVVVRPPHTEPKPREGMDETVGRSVYEEDQPARRRLPDLPSLSAMGVWAERFFAALSRPPSWVLYVLGIVVLAAMIFLAVVLINRGGKDGPSESAAAVDTVAVAPVEIEVPEPLLRDTMHVAIVAAGGKLEPIRIGVDGYEAVPRWVEEGDTLWLSATESFTLSWHLDRMELIVDGFPLPTSDRNDLNELVYTRERILAWLRGQRSVNSIP